MISSAVDSRNIAQETAFLIVSNLPFMFPAVVAWCMRMYPESLVYGFMTIISSVYHYLDQTGTRCLVSKHICLSTLHFLDFVYAYSMIGLTTSIWLHSSSVSMSPEQMYKNRLYRNMVATFTTLFLLLTIKDDVDMPIMIGTLCGGLLVYGLVMIFYIKIDMTSINWWYAPFVLVIYGCSFACFFLQEHNYWVIHSIWHICIAIGMGLTLMMRLSNFRWTCLRLSSANVELAVRRPIMSGSPDICHSRPSQDGPICHASGIIQPDPPYLTGATGGTPPP